MKKTEVTPEELSEASHSRSEELISRMGRLSDWIYDAHHASTGRFLESLLRTHLRRRLPKRFEVSTGFISTIERSDDETFERAVSRQFDILIWDSTKYPPLFEDEHFVVLLPQSCYAIIEVTHTLTGDKLKEDIEKLDSVHEIYRFDRFDFNPWTAVFSFQSDLAGLKSIGRKTAEALYFNKTLPLPVRYEIAMMDWLERPYMGFINGVCALDEGFIYATERKLGLMRAIYQGSRGKSEVDAFGLFEKKLLLNVLKSLDEKVKFHNPDLFSEFLHASAEDRNFFTGIGEFQERHPVNTFRCIKCKQLGNSFGERFQPKFNQTTGDGSRTGLWLERHGGAYWYGRYEGDERVGKWIKYEEDKMVSTKVEGERVGVMANSN